jgi:hypothetical protein
MMCGCFVALFVHFFSIVKIFGSLFLEILVW